MLKRKLIGVSAIVILMKLKTITWNIGGGKLLVKGSDYSRLDSYSIDGLDDIIKWLKQENADLITLQETQKNKNIDQVQKIATELGFNYIHDSMSDSHIDEGFQLGNAILSHYQIKNHKTGFFYNPKVITKWEDGSIATSFDKGFSTCEIEVGIRKVKIISTHLIPFRRFKINLESDIAKKILEDVQTKINNFSEITILQGDFNIDNQSIEKYLPKLFENGLEEVIQNEPTTPKGRKYDHILYRGMTLRGTRVNSTARTDHFPVIAEFEIA